MKVTECKRCGPQEMEGRLAREISKTRKVDGDFKRQVENDNVFTCEKHFHPENTETCE